MILANLIPAAPFVILVIMPSIEQIDPNLESAARVFGADTPRMSGTSWFPCSPPASSPPRSWYWCARSPCSSSRSSRPGADSQTLVVALYYAVFAAGVRAPQSVDAMAMVYMAVTLIWLLIALRFVNPTQLVSRVKEHPRGGVTAPSAGSARPLGREHRRAQHQGG